MRRGQALFLPIFIVGVIIMFVGVIFIGVLRAGQFEQARPVIGEKQQEVLNTVDQSIAMRAYAQRAAIVTANYVTRHPNLNIPIEAHALEIFSEHMRDYPLYPIQTQFTAEIEGSEIVFRTTEAVTQTIGDRNVITASVGIRGVGSGILTTWPTNELVITSLFGQRVGSPGSQFHAGIDIRARPYGEKVLAVGAGEVTPGVPTRNSVSLRMATGWTCEYLHVTPLQSTMYTILEGEVIAHVTDDGYHAHLDLRCYNHEETLSLTQARTLLGGEHVIPSLASQPDTIFAMVREQRRVTYVDPFCLFSPEIQQRVTYNPTITGWRFRQGMTQQEREFQTCDAYVQAGIFAQEESQAPIIEPLEDSQVVSARSASTTLQSRAEGIVPTDERYETTLRRLHETRGTSGMTLYEYSAQVARQERIPHEAVIAMIVVESLGDVSAVSPTGVVGIMQVQCTITADTLGLPELRNNIPACNQVRLDPEQSILSGTRHWASILRKYEGLSHQVAFAAAEYNAGPHILPLIERARAQGNQDPSYEEVMRLLTASYLAERADRYRGWTAEERSDKVTEIINHGLKVSRYYQMAGGSAPPVYVSAQQRGGYEFTIEVRAPIDLSQRNRLVNIQLRTNQIPVRAQQEQYLRSQNMLACGTYEQALSLATEACLDYFERGCGCPIPLPSDYHFTRPDRVEFNFFSANVSYQDESVVEFLHWLGPAPDEAWPGEFGIEQSSFIPEVLPTTDYGPRLFWDATRPDRVRVAQALQGGEIQAEDGLVWAVYDDERPAIILTQYPPACGTSPVAQQYTVVRNYCSADGEIWVDIRQEAPTPPENPLDLLGGVTSPFDQVLDLLSS